MHVEDVVCLQWQFAVDSRCIRSLWVVSSTRMWSSFCWHTLHSVSFHIARDPCCWLGTQVTAGIVVLLIGFTQEKEESSAIRDVPKSLAKYAIFLENEVSDSVNCIQKQVRIRDSVECIYKRTHMAEDPWLGYLHWANTRLADRITYISMAMTNEFLTANHISWHVECIAVFLYFYCLRLSFSIHKLSIKLSISTVTQKVL